jgi:ParB family chromosome partitioning protein
VPLRYLQRIGEDGEPEDVADTAATDAQFWGVRLVENTGFVDAEGNEVDEDDVDWDTAGDPEAEPEEGLRHADTISERIAFTPEWYCLDPEGAGLQVSDSYLRNVEWAERNRTGQSHTNATDLEAQGDDSDREAARQRAEEAEAEAKKRERRTVLALNKLGAAATPVRRAFVTTLLARLVDCTTGCPSDVGPAV